MPPPAPPSHPPAPPTGDGVRGRLGPLVSPPRRSGAPGPLAPGYVPIPPGPPWRLIAFLVLLAAVLAGGAAVFLWPQPADTHHLTDEELAALLDAHPSPPAAAASPTLLIVMTEPSGSVVSLGRDVVGVTPFRRGGLAPGFYALSLEAPDATRLDTLLYLRAGDTLRVWHRHRPDPAAYPDAGDLLALPGSPPDEAPQPEVRQPEVAAPAPASRQPPRAAPAPVAAAAPTAPAPEPPAPEPTPPPVSQAPALGSITVTTEPAGAQVLLDGRVVGRSPLRLSDLGPGSYHVVVQATGYRPVSQTVEVEAGRTRAFWTSLEVAQGTLVVSARPWASLYLNGELRARDTDLQQAFSLPAGTYRIRAVHPNLGAQERVVEVRPEHTTRVVFDLNR